VLLYGGNGAADYLGDTWSWNGSRWIKHIPSNDPSLRGTHAMVYNSARGVIVLFGGLNGTMSDDMWEY
jgi:hypothetical protein